MPNTPPDTAGTANPSSIATVIVPLDGSLAAEGVLRMAGDIARCTGSALVLLHVVPYPEPLEARPTHGAVWPDTEELPPDVLEAIGEAQRYLDALGQAIGATGTVVRVGDPFSRIRQEARTLDRSLIVLTSKATATARVGQHSELARRLAFSHVAPVLMVPPPESQP